MMADGKWTLHYKAEDVESRHEFVVQDGDTGTLLARLTDFVVGQGYHPYEVGRILKYLGARFHEVPTRPDVGITSHSNEDWLSEPD